ncbi:hypothetical protein BJ684DRAFT_20781, partial [Piptocephalis cylindrospora]
MPTQLSKDLEALSLKTFHIRETDLAHEEELQRHPYSLRHWLNYLEDTIEEKDAEAEDRINTLYERAVKALPSSYKLWKAYLDRRRSSLQHLPYLLNQDAHQSLNHAYERALLTLHKAPRLWTDYLSFLSLQPRITQVRQAFDRALRALPLTQHPRIWDLYLPWAKDRAGGLTAIHVQRRYLRLHPHTAEDLVDLLLQEHRWSDVITELHRLIHDPTFRSAQGRAPHQLWILLCQLISEHPNRLPPHLNAEVILRSGASAFPDQAGRLWCALAQYWVRLGFLDRARDTYEEGISHVTTVRDFTLIFDAYAAFEESILSSYMEHLQDNQSDEDVGVDWRMARFSRLLDRRPFLVSDVRLRKNPHDATEWLSRVNLHPEDAHSAREAEFTNAIQTIQPKKASGPLSDLYVAWMRHLEHLDRLDEARDVMRSAVNVSYRSVKELADVWCEWAEMEVRQGQVPNAIALLAEATSAPRQAPSIDYKDDRLPPPQTPLQESNGTVESTKAIYERILHLRIATPQILINYAQFLQDASYYEDSFRVYEKGVDLFPYPVAFEIWNIYLSKFIHRYAGNKIDRARDLFEQALTKCPAKYVKSLYRLYGKMEEDHGLGRHALRIYDRATRAVDPDDRLEMYKYYIAKAATAFGLASTREIHEDAISRLPDAQAKDMSLSYADLEIRLGEIDRARAIYAHASQLCDPRTVP